MSIIETLGRIVSQDLVHITEPEDDNLALCGIDLSEHSFAVERLDEDDYCPECMGEAERQGILLI